MWPFDFLKNAPKPTFTNSEKNNGMTTSKAERIVQTFGKFLSESIPVIKDAALLPYPKETIDQAISISIHELRNQNDPESKRLIGSLEFCQVGLHSFATIDPEDRKAVDHFNQFRKVSDVPKGQQLQCVDLIVKYTNQGMNT